ncbi:hypothetical protein ABZX92_15270 [Lentzea sp. NPDC006480]|uniref:hypothetical protein n=1 Tax=Lentzea sp. NPDC006480 TaxID=3157176 RepID=UPI0033B7A6D7
MSFDLLAGALTAREAARATGTLHITGNPGGRIHLRNGWIISVESAGAPGPDTLLLRSGRISESAAAASRENVGTTALHVVAMMATQDAAFSAVAGEIEECVLTGDVHDVAVPMSTGVEPVRLLQETSRRLTSLYALPCPLSPHRERVAPTREAELREHSAVRADVLTHATGRRCARDLAFVCGRSVYSVTIEVCRMVGEGLLMVVPGTTVTTPAAEPLMPLRPRNPQRPAPVPETGADGDDEPLPRSLRRQLLPKLFRQPERKQL